MSSLLVYLVLLEAIDTVLSCVGCFGKKMKHAKECFSQDALSILLDIDS